MARYVVSDLHGRFDLYQEIEKFRKPEDKIICLGDCGDRGPQSFETIKAIADNPDWTCLMGNHEHMTLEALKENVYDRDSEIYAPDATSVSWSNGGESTYNAMIENDAMWWIDYLEKLPYRLDIKNEMGYDIILTHSGFDPTYGHADNGDKNFWDYIWDRSHINMPWPLGPKLEKTILIHGHTPIPTIKKDWTAEDGSYSYACGHKINIDAGSVWTGAAILLDIDTFDEHIFDLGGKHDS